MLSDERLVQARPPLPRRPHLWLAHALRLHPHPHLQQPHHHGVKQVCRQYIHPTFTFSLSVRQCFQSFFTKWKFTIVLPIRASMQSATNTVLLGMAACDLATIIIPAPWYHNRTSSSTSSWYQTICLNISIYNVDSTSSSYSDAVSKLNDDIL